MNVLVVVSFGATLVVFRSADILIASDTSSSSIKVEPLAPFDPVFVAVMEVGAGSLQEVVRQDCGSAWVI